jgi:peptide/nickel transport system ATP-binding protein
MNLSVRGLKVAVKGAPILREIDFSLAPGRAAGIAGASGSGKTMFARAIMGLLPEGHTVSGEYMLDTEHFDLDADEAVWRGIRGKRLGLIMQDPFSSLDPMAKCGDQITAGLGKEERRGFDVARALEEVDLPRRAADRYPGELSGGMRQRVVIAAALAKTPELLIADEATTALDVITQKEILDLIGRLQKERCMSLIIITHDLRVVAERTEELAVFHNGIIVERGASARVISSPQDSYTKALLDANCFAKPVFSVSSGSVKPAHTGPLLEARHLVKRYSGVTALRDANIVIHEGECVGVVGESGSGKTTLARCVAGLTRADSGEVLFMTGKPPPQKNKKMFNVQMVFQDPYSSLNPAHTVREALAEALGAAGKTADAVPALLEMVELPLDFLDRKPARLSGGQRQRVAIARALAPAPRLLICDESVSALDVLVRNQILKTLKNFQKKQNIAILFITHDLTVVYEIASRVYVMRDAQVVEEGSRDQLFNNPRHPYTKALLEAAIR